MTLSSIRPQLLEYQKKHWRMLMRVWLPFRFIFSPLLTLAEHMDGLQSEAGAKAEMKPAFNFIFYFVTGWWVLRLWKICPAPRLITQCCKILKADTFSFFKDESEKGILMLDEDECYNMSTTKIICQRKQSFITVERMKSLFPLSEMHFIVSLIILTFSFTSA